MTDEKAAYEKYLIVFQYRKRYEVTCDYKVTSMSSIHFAFQYRKRYEVTCD